MLAKLRIEACSICQLACLYCPNPKGEFKNTPVGYGYLKAADFEKIIIGNPSVREIELSNYGEFFLNPDLVKILKIADNHSINITIINGTNLNTLSEEQIEALVKYNVKHINISIDGTTQEVYGFYRKGGDLGKILNNIQKINQYKAHRKSISPKLTWQFIAFPHNEHQMEEAIKTAKDLNMDFYVKRDWSGTTPKHIKAKEDLFCETPLDFCRQLVEFPQINWNGEVLGCCINTTHSYGNVYSDNLDKIMTTENYQNNVNTILGKTFNPKSPCDTCGIFRKKIFYMNFRTYLKNQPGRTLLFLCKNNINVIYGILKRFYK